MAMRPNPNDDVFTNVKISPQKNTGAGVNSVEAPSPTKSTPETQEVQHPHTNRHYHAKTPSRKALEILSVLPSIMHETCPHEILGGHCKVPSQCAYRTFDPSYIFPPPPPKPVKTPAKSPMKTPARSPTKQKMEKPKILTMKKQYVFCNLSYKEMYEAGITGPELRELEPYVRLFFRGDEEWTYKEPLEKLRRLHELGQYGCF